MKNNFTETFYEGATSEDAWTEHCGPVVNTPGSYLGRPGLKSRPGDLLS
jgi:hypothetical protein